MGIQLLSVSHKVAPVHIRELFSFNEEQQKELLQRLLEKEFIAEAVVISTCNRTEIYTYMPVQRHSRQAFAWMKECMLQAAGAALQEHIEDYIRLYQDRPAIHHLFLVAAGLDSMVLGEDQILGQVKQAHKRAMGHNLCGTYLNTLFRLAVTGAKRVKTDTEISRTSVSTATLALKAAEQALGSLQGKRLLIIGASGEIGGIVLKNALAIQGLEVSITMREHKHRSAAERGVCRVLPYEERYRYMAGMDVIISATASPHYTITKKRFADAVPDDRERVIVDLAVPMDVEESIGTLPHVQLYNIEDFTALAARNNEKKKQAAEAAEAILEEYEEQFIKWMIFRDNGEVLQALAGRMEAAAEKKGMKKAVEQLLYDVREQCSAGQLESFCAIAGELLT